MNDIVKDIDGEIVHISRATVVGSIPPYFDENSQTWVAVREHLVNLLAEARVRNDSINNSAEQTAAIRGEIKLIKRLLNLPEQAKKGREQRPQKPRQIMPGEEY